MTELLSLHCLPAGGRIIKHISGQIQKNLLQEASNGKPLVVITKNLSDAAFGLLCNNCNKCIVIQEGKAMGTTEFWIEKKYQTVEGTYWNIGGFLEII